MNMLEEIKPTQGGTWPFLIRPSLNSLARLETVPELWTDKSDAPGGHDYLRIYDREFTKWREEPINFMEIGLNRGASIKLWLQYFTKARITGVDLELERVDQPKGFEDGRLTLVKGDQFSREFWLQFAESNPLPFDIIIDDGCHYSGPIAVAFECLWPRVKPGGYYVVEDITEVRNPDSRTVGYPDQLQFVQNFVENIIFGRSDIDEMEISKDLCILRKKA